MRTDVAQIARDRVIDGGRVPLDRTRLDHAATLALHLLRPIAAGTV
jgi:hypothetical protein